MDFPQERFLTPRTPFGTTAFVWLVEEGLLGKTFKVRGAEF